MVLGPEIFMYKLLFNKACNNYTDEKVNGLREKLRGEDDGTLDMVEDLIGYLDSELPRADEDDVERLLDQAAPVLAALLVPMKQKYDKIVEIKEEVTEKITEVVPVEEIVQDYEETLDDLRDFCRHISEEVGTNWTDNMDELHRKLWELEMNDREELSGENQTSCQRPRLRRQFSEDVDKLAIDSPDFRRRFQMQASMEEDSVVLGTLVTSPVQAAKLAAVAPEMSRLTAVPAEMARLTPPERFQSPAPANSTGTSPSHPNPNIEVSKDKEVSPVSSRSISPVQFHNLQYQFSIGSISMGTSERSGSPSMFYSPFHSRRTSVQLQGSDLIARYISTKHPQMYHSDEFKDFASRRSSLNVGTLYDLSHCCDPTSTTDGVNRRAVSRRQSALSLLVDYVKYRIGADRFVEHLSPTQIENITEEEDEEVKINIIRSSVSSDN